MHKVYLSASNEADPLDVTFIRQYLAEFKNVQVIQYSSGNPPKPTESDTLLLVPPRCNRASKYSTEITIGSGQYSVLTQFEPCTYSVDDVYVYLAKENKTGKPIIGNVGCYDKIDGWSVNYQNSFATLEVKAACTLDKVFDEVYDIKKSAPPIKPTTGLNNFVPSIINSSSLKVDDKGLVKPMLAAYLLV